MKKKKFNYYRFTMVILVIAAIIFFAVKYKKQKDYEKTDEYAFIQLGYTIDEINDLNKYLKESQIKDILKMKYNEYIIPFIKEKYFIYSNLNKYLDYKSENKKEEYSDIVAIINTEANIEWIDEEKESDTSLEELMLVNRLYSIGEYEPEDIEEVPISIAFAGIKLRGLIIPNIGELIASAKLEGYNYIVSGGYRSYESQETLYNNYVKSYGEEDADKIVARPGHSEYQTGLTVDISYYDSDETKKEEAYNWLLSNMKDYGFVVRHTSDKENLTGFSESKLKLRYVGYDAAYTMYEENLCFEEYYAYYVANKDNKK